MKNTRINLSLVSIFKYSFIFAAFLLTFLMSSNIVNAGTNISIYKKNTNNINFAGQYSDRYEFIDQTSYVEFMIETDNHKDYTLDRLSLSFGDSNKYDLKNAIKACSFNDNGTHFILKLQFNYNGTSSSYSCSSTNKIEIKYGKDNYPKTRGKSEETFRIYVHYNGPWADDPSYTGAFILRNNIIETYMTQLYSTTMLPSYKHKFEENPFFYGPVEQSANNITFQDGIGIEKIQYCDILAGLCNYKDIYTGGNSNIHKWITSPYSQDDFSKKIYNPNSSMSVRLKITPYVGLAVELEFYQNSNYPSVEYMMLGNISIIDSGLSYSGGPEPFDGGIYYTSKLPVGSLTSDIRDDVEFKSVKTYYTLCTGTGNSDCNRVEASSGDVNNKNYFYLNVDLSKILIEDGSYLFEIEIIDIGNHITRVKFSIVLDRKAPIINNIKLIPFDSDGYESGYTPTDEIVINGEFSDFVSGIEEIIIYDNSFFTEDKIMYRSSFYGENSFNLDEIIYLSDDYGGHVVSITVKDKAGNVNTSTEINIILDNIYPDITYNLSESNPDNHLFHGYNEKSNDESLLYLYGNETVAFDVVANDEYFNSASFTLLDSNYNNVNYSCLDQANNSIINGNLKRMKNTLKCSITDSPNFNQEITFRAFVKDKAGNITNIKVISFYHIDHSRDLSINDNTFKIKAKGALDYNSIGDFNKAAATFTIYYDLNLSKDYLDPLFGHLEIGNSKEGRCDDSNFNFVDSSMNHTIYNSDTLKITSGYSNSNLNTQDWHNQFKSGDEKYAFIELKNKYGITFSKSVKIKFDYINPTIDKFIVFRPDHGDYSESWTNTLNNNFVSSYSDDINGTGVYGVEIYGSDGKNDLLDFSLEKGTISLKNTQSGSKFIIHMHVYDKAGNVAVLFSNELRYDNISPDIGDGLTEDTKEVKFNLANKGPQINSNIYYTNVTNPSLSIHANDITSGITEVCVTTLFNGLTKKDCVKEELIESYFGEITIQLPESKNGDNDGARKISISIKDAAGNKFELVNKYTIVYDTIAPVINYSNLDVITSKVTVTINDENISGTHINPSDINYYLTTKNDNLTYEEIKDSFLVNKNKNGDDAAFVLPRSRDKEKIYVYIYISADKYVDYAGNNIAGYDSNIYFNKLSYDNPDIINSTLPKLDSSVFKPSEGYIYQDNGILVVYSKNDNALANYSLTNLNNYLSTNSSIDGTIIGKDNIDFINSNGTYAYDGVIFKNKEDTIYTVLDVVIVNVGPFIVNLKQAVTNASIVINTGEELNNIGVNFASNYGKVNVQETITLNGVKIDNIDTNVSGIYSIRTKAVDELGNSSYLDRTIVVNDSIDKTVKVSEIQDIALENISIENKVNVNDSKQINSNNIIEEYELVMIDSLFQTYSFEDTIIDNSLIIKDIIFTFKLFSKYFFKIYDG